MSITLPLNEQLCWHTSPWRSAWLPASPACEPQGSESQEDSANRPTQHKHKQPGFSFEALLSVTEVNWRLQNVEITVVVEHFQTSDSSRYLDSKKYHKRQICLEILREAAAQKISLPTPRAKKKLKTLLLYLMQGGKKTKNHMTDLGKQKKKKKNQIGSSQMFHRQSADVELK